MRPSTEEFLYFLLWNVDTLAHPTWRNLNDGFEAWAWRHDLGRRIAELQRQKLLERLPSLDCRRIVRLTEAGRRAALGGRDPVQRWSRPWDGRWRMVVFDIPVFKGALKLQMWRFLRSNSFGFLQNSVWITPDSLEAAKEVIKSDVPNAEALVLFEGCPCGGETNANVVTGAWDFEEINRRYQRVLVHLRQAQQCAARQDLLTWARCDRRLWSEAIRLDPLLPRVLLPAGYLGEKAWEKRNSVLRRLAGVGGAARV